MELQRAVLKYAKRSLAVTYASFSFIPILLTCRVVSDFLSHELEREDVFWCSVLYALFAALCLYFQTYRLIYEQGQVKEKRYGLTFWSVGCDSMELRQVQILSTSVLAVCNTATGCELGRIPLSAISKTDSDIWFKCLETRRFG
ncbi:hypothetical protein ATDW_32490 [Asticcacaulis sp. DW145]|uniref:hypothetical protein n=1 Tax=Asticcacaulis sp. DW145 TaxID=3095608 RepID=UPI003086D3C8|nr:hypothetical protein ATDW_32490 [Asticcacaulis sp. DW145]